jgi:glycosyltransferase involved in cell wall biosynthesis
MKKTTDLFFSVIIPVYERPKLVLRALASVLAQKDAPTFDLWVIDDGSSPAAQAATYQGIQNLRQAYAGKISGHYLWTPHRGVSAARNLGARLSSGQFIAFLDSDDEWRPEKLAAMQTYIEQHPSLRLIHSHEIWRRGDKVVAQKAIHRKSGGRIFARCVERCLISPSAAVLRRDLWEEVGGFRETYTVCEDFDLWLDITAQEEVGYIEEPLIIKHGGHPGQLSLQYKVMDEWRWKSLLRWWQKRTQLTLEEQQALQQALLRIGDILSKGYQKYAKPALAAQYAKDCQAIAAAKDVVTASGITYDGIHSTGPS